MVRSALCSETVAGPLAMLLLLENELKFDGGFRVVRRGNVPHGPLLANSRSCHGFRMNCTNPAHSGRPVPTGLVNEGGAPSGRGNSAGDAAAAECSRTALARLEHFQEKACPGLDPDP